MDRVINLMVDHGIPDRPGLGAVPEPELGIGDYAGVGDGRTVALIGLDGSIDWLCLPDLDSPSVFAGVLDRKHGGRFELRPESPCGVRRRYLPDTNVLETTFTTATGRVRVTDAMTLPGSGLTPLRELARRIEGLAGHVHMRWRVEPRFGYGDRPTRFARRCGVPVATSAADAVAVCAWDCGEPQMDDRGIGARLEVRQGDRGLISLVVASGEPLVFPARDEVEVRLVTTAEFWRRWSAGLLADGPWRASVLRSALALKLLVFAPSGAIAAAATSSLPEVVGGGRNWDYRFSWIRDSSFVLEALLQLGCAGEARSFFWWFMHATRLTQPHLQVFYRLDGGTRAPERELSLAGYRGSRPVRVGNAAVNQLQLDVFGSLLDAAWVYASRGHRIDRDTGRALAGVADLVCQIWRRPDHGIWEVRSAVRHFTHSKAMCWVALDRALRLAAGGHLPGRSAARWREEAAEIRAFIETRCWSERLQSYVRSADSEELDANLLMLAIERYHAPDDPRMIHTIDAIRRALAKGPFVYRYAALDGIGGEREGAFLTCSFWLAEALALSGRRDEAADLMDELVGLANDVGLYAEEIDPRTRQFLGNFPQALVHLALISAAVAWRETEPRA